LVDPFMKQRRWWVYLIRCGDGTYYAGITTDPERRLRQHQIGKGAKYTRGRGPLTLVYAEEVGSRTLAMRRERQIKELRHAAKEALRDEGRSPQG
jgi:putative endonuclease